MKDGAGSHESEKWKWSCSVMSDPQQPHGLQPSRLLRPWDFPSKSTGVGCHCLLQHILLKHVKISISLQFSHSVVSDCLWPHGLQHTRAPCPPPTPRAYSNSCPLSRWCHPTISSSHALFFFWPQSFPASGAFPMSQLFTSGGQRIGALASASVLPVNIQSWQLTLL